MLIQSLRNFKIVHAILVFKPISNTSVDTFQELLEAKQKQFPQAQFGIRLGWRSGQSVAGDARRCRCEIKESGLG